MLAHKPQQVLNLLASEGFAETDPEGFYTEY